MTGHKDTWYAYTDGSCMRNPDGEGGWACIVFDPAGSPIKSSGYAPTTTNQRMELMAVIQAIKMVPEGRPMVIYSDSAYVCNSIMKGWLKKWTTTGWKTSSGAAVANQDLWLDMIDGLAKHEVSMVWVKGHSTNIFNNECDIMARDISVFAKNVHAKFTEYINT